MGHTDEGVRGCEEKHDQKGTAAAIDLPRACAVPCDVSRAPPAASRSRAIKVRDRRFPIISIFRFRIHENQRERSLPVTRLSGVIERVERVKRRDLTKQGRGKCQQVVCRQPRLISPKQTWRIPLFLAPEQYFATDTTETEL